MTAKAKIVEQLGEVAVLLPELLAAALEANGRAKVRLTLLQEALSHALNPASPPQTLDAERRAAGLDLHSDSIVKEARVLADGRFFAPGASQLIEGLHADIDAMMAPILLTDKDEAEVFAKRLAALRSACTRHEDDMLTQSAVAAMTSARPGGHDSEHLLIMDLHKAINRIEAESAVETVEGARVHRLTLLEKQRVEAFMRGLNRTRGLAFGHPGLGTTATRSGESLVIQNDIGATDAHVLVIHVQDLTVTITYTDIHRARAKFFIHLFHGHGVDWSPLAEKSSYNVGKDGQFLHVTGLHSAKNAKGLDEFLEFLGSRLVFLIDWNKARKALRNFVDGEAAIGVLRWAARHELGHRGFLELGGDELIYEAVRSAGAGHVPYGRRLDAALGAKETAEFLKHTLQVASEGLTSGRSTRLLKDEIQAKFVSEFESIEGSLLTIISRHLGLSRTMAGLILDAVRDGRTSGKAESSLSGQARRLEHKADSLTAEARTLALRLPETSKPVWTVAINAEEANDSLEEAAFLLSLVSEIEGGQSGLQPLAGLAGIAVESVAHMIRAVEASHNLPEGLQADVTDALTAIDAVIGEEKKADEAVRQAMVAFISSSSDARLLILRIEIGQALETATDHLAHAALALRNRILGEFPA